jgi:hypothetical protein
MKTAVGIFRDRRSAESAVTELLSMGFTSDRITLLSPGDPVPTGQMPTTEGEPPGTGKAVGTVVGTAVGAGAGFPLGVAASTALIPGIGPIIAAGVLGAAILGAAGYAIGGALETELTEGVPKDEAFVYLDALRRGRSVVIALAEDEKQAEAARAALRVSGAESLDAARDEWWLGLRSAEREQYVAAGSDFDVDEKSFRRGFEAALSVDAGVRTYGEAQGQLRALAPEFYDRESFRRGFERGLAYRDAMRVRRDAAA